MPILESPTERSHEEELRTILHEIEDFKNTLDFNQGMVLGGVEILTSAELIKLQYILGLFQDAGMVVECPRDTGFGKENVLAYDLADLYRGEQEVRAHISSPHP